jgi:Na+/H+ antiporter NhaD/arsenite permease-like protein
MSSSRKQKSRDKGVHILIVVIVVVMVTWMFSSDFLKLTLKMGALHCMKIILYLNKVDFTN